VLVGPGDGLIGSSGAAGEWLAEFGTKLPSGLPLPIAALARTVFERGHPATTTLTTLAGRRAVLEAALLDGGEAPQVVVVISAASPEQTLQHFSLAAELSPREQQVLEAVLNGHSTRAISTALHISEHTVQAHLTSVFAKTGVRSRRDLIRRLS
jgi:DNA-binding CsgD family transcriptional regulator